MGGRVKGGGLVASPEQVERIRSMFGKPVSDEHLLWIKARGQRLPNRGQYSATLLSEMEGIGLTTVIDILHYRGAYTRENPTLGYFGKLQAWASRG